MLDFAIFAVTFITVLIITVFYLYPGSRKTGTTIPGMDPSDPKDGNISDIQHAGSMHEFLVALHDRHGPMASFWLGTQLVVSLASPQHFMEHLHVFDRAGDLFSAFKPLLGDSSVFFANGTSARREHRFLTEALSQDKCDAFLRIFYRMSDEIFDKFQSLPHGQHVPLHQYMTALALKALLVTLCGRYFLDSQHILDFRSKFEICSSCFEQKLVGENLDDSLAEQKVREAIAALRTQILSAIQHHKTSSQLERNIPPFIDTLIKLAYSDDKIVDTVLTFVHCGFQTTGNLLTWLCYHLAANSEVQKKVVNEAGCVMDNSKTNCGKFEEMSYLRQAVEETLRLNCIVPFSTRCQDVDVEVCGHTIPKGTPVIHALGVVQNDVKIWTSSAKTFDVERFSAEVRPRIPPLAFSPFGFGGKRSCPGSHFVQTLAAAFVARMPRNIHLRLIDGQVVLPNYNMFTKPMDEIWVTVNKPQWWQTFT